MNTTTTTTDVSTTETVLDYQLTEADVRSYCVSGRPVACWRACVRCKVGLALLGLVGAFLVGICFAEHGAKVGARALGATLAVVVALAWLRRARSDRRVRRLARAFGLPCSVRLAVSGRGIVKEPGAEPTDPGRTFAWSEVVEIARVDSLTVVRLRPAGSLLLVPDRAFPDAETREAMARDVRTWLDAARSTPRG